MIIYPIDFQYSDDITVVNRETFEPHLRLYRGYVEKFNEVQEILTQNAGREKSNATYSRFRGLKRGETYSLNGVILHELYFDNIGGTQNYPDQMIKEVFQKCFVQFEDWVEDFTASAKASRGWVILSYDQRSRRLINFSLDTHDSGAIISAYPLIVIDMYEHAYYKEYGDNKAEYINRFMLNIDWSVVKKRFLQLQ